MKNYPCQAPFSQLYVLPRTMLDLRFCSYHQPVFVNDQKKMYEGGTKELNHFFNSNRELNRRREEFLKGNFIEGAGCSPDCFWFCKWKTSGEGFSPDDYKTDSGEYQIRKLWLTIGPDCNIFCRYYLDPKEFHIDYNTCDLQVMDLARDFVAQGGEILLTGGEPFLPKFKLSQVLEQLSIIEEIKGEFENHTNGMFLNERNRNLILRGPVRSVDISMDTLRKDLFEYLRKGADFDKVWGNVLALKKERDQLGLERPRILILCAVMTDNYSYIIETVEKAISEGLMISLNALFKSYYSSDFSGAHGLQNLEIQELRKLYDDILFLEQKYGPTGPVHYHGIKGQVENLIESKASGSKGPQVVLGDGGEAKRKASVRTLLRRGKFKPAIMKLARNMLGLRIRGNAISFIWTG